MTLKNRFKNISAVRISMKSKRLLTLFFVLHCSIFMSGCGVYSFTGTNLSPDIKTFSVLNFTMGTAGGPSDLPQRLTEELKEYFQRNTSLISQPGGGDLILEGSITGYDVLAAAPTANDQAGLNRLNVTVQVRYTNAKDETKNFDQSFTYYADFPQDQTLNQNEARLLPTIRENLVQQIFNKSAADW
ncbi:LPS assembly lipoprotein LptE [Dyadobacter chenwenxiniae]|uniref:LPS assembly lipoprotein LptE n=1 Tax=Dyadobacter chenwenxiniae TaxID=2906456 RepID=A0A9X1PQ38_9BACT|nr:LptE family protein [Dyadobacter chenwenxiniae]MCF0049972.1 LPS assembly lipoprotein LptE [Dyadobacter chenwenxiniae]MCF0064988.1 LPS assembly lipoprotein LptE [Dyadobacter chenwenxiniae]UON83108.1 LPS assembly lipoprotein LptE [Dyadobacter chenwenxiniae]